MVSLIYETLVLFISHKQLSAIIQPSICYDLAQKYHSYQMHWPTGCLQKGQLMISYSFLLQFSLLCNDNIFSLQVASLNSHRRCRSQGLAVLRSVACISPSAKSRMQPFKEGCLNWRSFLFLPAFPKFPAVLSQAKSHGKHLSNEDSAEFS